MVFGPSSVAVFYGLASLTGAKVSCWLYSTQKALTTGT